uniref:Uncharacterized protein n=1 Tax=uncultured bacterium W5-77b TaxID=1131000 RepID=H9BWF6_9BACT|nr:hypothetical protein [uncultured bacterium W5-77b]
MGEFPKRLETTIPSFGQSVFFSEKDIIKKDPTALLLDLFTE